MAGLLWGEGRGEEDVERRKVNNSDAKIASPYTIFENASNLFYANATEKAKSTSFI